MSVAQEQTACIHHSHDTEFNQQDFKIEIKYHYGRYYPEWLNLEKAYPDSLGKNKSELVMKYLGRKTEMEVLVMQTHGRRYQL